MGLQPLWRFKTPHEWEAYNFGPCQLEFLDREGNGFSGTQQEFFDLHKSLFGLVNRVTGVVILINHYGEIAARGATPTPPTVTFYSVDECQEKEGEP